MTVVGYQLDRAPVYPASDRSLYHALFNEQIKVLNRGNKLAVASSGLSVSVNTGQAIIMGTLLEVTSAETLSVAGNTSGYICATVDLTQQNTVSGTAGQSDYGVTFLQVRIEVIQGNLTQDDLNNGGFIYNLPLASYTSDGTTATVTPINNALVPLNNDTLEAVLLSHGVTAGDTGWLNLGLAQSWQNDISHYRIKNGVVHLQILGINSGKLGGFNTTAPYLLATLPANAWPSYKFTKLVAVRNSSSGPVGSVGWIDINTNGTIEYSCPNGQWFIWIDVEFPLG